MESTVFDWSDAPVRTTKTGIVRQFFQSPTNSLQEVECHATTVNAGVPSHSPHEDPTDELVIVKDGEIVILIGQEETIVRAGSMAFLATGQWHGIRNASQAPATYYVIRWRS